MLPSLIEVMQTASVEVNGVWIPLGTLPEALRRYCVPALFLEENSPIELSKSGSAVLLNYRGGYFAICTRHQFGQENQPLSVKDPGRFAILFNGPGGKRIATTPFLSGNVSVPGDPDHSLNDLAITEFVVPHLTPERASQFLRLDFSATFADRPEEARMASFAIGFPTYAVNYQIPEDELGRLHIKLPWVKIWLDDAVGHEPGPLEPDHRSYMIQSKRFGQNALRDPDGVSGSPVFSIWRRGTAVHYGFAGVITHARERTFAVYPAAEIQRALDHWIDD